MTSTRTSKYIVTADDYGACDFIDQGIIKAIEKGKINSVACFAVAFGRQDEFDKRMDTLLALRAKGHEFAIGLHFSLTAGCPVIQRENTLSMRNHDDGLCYFLSPEGYPFDSIDPIELRTEFHAQVNRLADKLGGVDKIDSISNHHGIVYLKTSLFKRYANLVAELKRIPIRSPRIWRKAGLQIRDWDHRPWNPLIRQGLWLRQLGRIRAANEFEDRIDFTRERGLLTPTCLVDEIYGQPDPLNLSDLFDCFNKEIFAAEFMFHLGDPDYRVLKGLQNGEAYKLGAPGGIDPNYFDGRELELALLLDFDFSKANATKTYFRNLDNMDIDLPLLKT